MIREHDRVVLTAPVSKEGLESGDVETVVHVYQDGQAFEVELVSRSSHRQTVEYPCNSVQHIPSPSAVYLSL